MCEISAVVGATDEEEEEGCGQDAKRGQAITRRTRPTSYPLSHALLHVCSCLSLVAKKKLTFNNVFFVWTNYVRSSTRPLAALVARRTPCTGQVIPRNVPGTRTQRRRRLEAEVGTRNAGV